MESLGTKKDNLEREPFSLESFVPLPASKPFVGYLLESSEKPEEIAGYLKEKFKYFCVSGIYDPLGADIQFFKNNGRKSSVDKTETFKRFFPSGFANIGYYLCYFAGIEGGVTEESAEDILHSVSNEMSRLRGMFPQLGDVFLLRNLLRSRDIVGFDGVVSQLELFEDLKSNDPWFQSASLSLLEAVSFFATTRDDFKIERFKYNADDLSSIYMNVPLSYIYCALLYSNNPDYALRTMIISRFSAISVV